MTFEAKNTHQLQLDSLLAYMDSLGYKYNNKGWETDAEPMSHVQRISHRTAIALHNLPASGWVLRENKLFSPPINGKLFDIVMNGYTLSRTQATKLVQKVKLQPNRKTDEGIEIQSHMVKPFQPYMTVTLGLDE